MAMILEPGRTFVDNSNRILTGGTIRFCEPGTGSITLKATYPTDADLLATTNANANPMAFNSAGRMPYAAHGSGAYRIVVRDSGGNTIYDISDVSAFDASTISFTPSSGATATDVQTFLRTEYSKSSAESGASLTITNYGYRRGDVRRYGSVDAANDSTTGFTRAALVAATHPTIIPSGTWNISSATFTDGATIITDGFSTIIKQIAGYDGAPNTQTALIKLAGSNIAFALNGVKVMGQIATDSGEHNHGVMIYKTGASIENITVGDVWGAELRGDALYIGAPNTYQTKNVRVGRVIGEDIHRNIVSIVGGNHITIDSIIAEGGVGLSTFDIEPDSGSTACTDIHVGYIRGGVVQILGQPSAILDRVTIGSVELDPAYQPIDSGAYSLYSTYIQTAMWLRNCRNVRVEHVRVNGHDDFAATYIFSGGDVRGENISFGTFNVSDVGSADVTYNAAVVMGNCNNVAFDEVTFARESDGDYFFYGDPSGSTTTSIRINKLTGDSRVARYVSNSVFQRLFVSSAVVADTAFVNVYDSKVMASDITIPTLISFSDRVSFENVDATCSTSYLGTSTTKMDVIRPAGGLASILHGSATYDPANLVDGDGVTTTVTCTGASLGDFAQASFSNALQGIMLTAWVSASNTVSVRFQNETGGAIDLASGTLSVRATKPA